MNYGRLFTCIAVSVCSLAAREISWTRLDAGKFTIISAVSEKETLSWAVEFEQFHQGIQKVLRINEAALQPVTVILFRSQSEMRPYKPLEKGKPAQVDGMFMRTPLGNFIEAAVDSEDQQTRQLIFHEGVHWLTNVSDTQPPLWLDEGLAEVFSTFSVDGDLYNYGQVLPWHVLLLDHGPMMPLKQLLAIQHGSLLYNEGERTSIFYAESWAFVHYLLFSGNLEERTKYNQLVRALRADADPDVVFKQVFGADCAAMDRRLRDYLRNGSYTINRIRFDRTRVERSFKIRPASRPEVDLAQSCLLSAVDRPAEALPRLQRITAEMPENPLPWEAEGFAAYQTQDYGETETCFARAAKLGSHNYFVYSFLGDLALGALPGRITATVPSDLRLGADYYEHELDLNPGDQHAYDNLAGNSYALDPMTALDEATLAEGKRRFPLDRMIRVGVAVVGLKRGDATVAASTLESLANDRSPSNKDASAYARTILESRMQSEAFDRINDLWQKQDFTGVIASVDELLRSQSTLAPENRENLLNTRARAAIADKIRRAVDLASSGNLPEAKALLLEADANATDRQMKTQIQLLLDRIASAMSTRQQ